VGLDWIGSSLFSSSLETSGLIVSEHGKSVSWRVNEKKKRERGTRGEKGEREVRNK